MVSPWLEAAQLQRASPQPGHCPQAAPNPLPGQVCHLRRCRQVLAAPRSPASQAAPARQDEGINKPPLLGMQAGIFPSLVSTSEAMGHPQVSPWAAKSLSRLFTTVSAPSSPSAFSWTPTKPHQALTFGPGEPGSPSGPGFPREPFGNIWGGDVSQNAVMQQAPPSHRCCLCAHGQASSVQTGLAGDKLCHRGPSWWLLHTSAPWLALRQGCHQDG